MCQDKSIFFYIEFFNFLQLDQLDLEYEYLITLNYLKAITDLKTRNDKKKREKYSPIKPTQVISALEKLSLLRSFSIQAHVNNFFFVKFFSYIFFCIDIFIF